MPSVAAQFSADNPTPPRICRMFNGTELPTFLDISHRNDTRPTQPDPFLLTSCHECFELVTQVSLANSSLDYHNESQIEEACQLVDFECVSIVRQCCASASSCCVRQLRAISNATRNTCPLSWDGISCIDETEENMTTKVACPAFIPFFNKKSFSFFQSKFVFYFLRICREKLPSNES